MSRFALFSSKKEPLPVQKSFGPAKPFLGPQRITSSLTTWKPWN